MQNIGLIFLAFAFVFACLAAFWSPSAGRVNLLSLAVACWIASELIGGLGRVFH
jgi:fructose-specific phosphotransferase system IIC component